MKVLFVCSGNSNKISLFTKEQADSIKKHGVKVDFFLIKGRGAFGYLKNLLVLKKKINRNKYDLIHAHYGLSALLANLQRKVRVIATYHGSDLHNKRVRIFSKLSTWLSRENIFVSSNLANISKYSKPIIIPCGIDMEIFKPIEKPACREKMKLNLKKKYILFSSSFNISVKNYPLASEAINLLNDKDINLLELKDYSRGEVALLMNAVDLCLMVSKSEGSPQVIKEAMACNCPIVSTDVGDVKEIIGKTDGCYVCSYDPKDVADKIKKALDFGKRTNGREKIKYLDEKIIAQNIIDLYNNILKTKCVNEICKAIK